MNRNPNILAWLVWTLAALFVVFNYVYQYAPNVIAEDLSKSFGVSAGALGNIAAAFLYAYAFLQIPVGLIVDRYGTRWPMVMAIAVAGMGAIGFSQTHTAISAQLARVVMGAGSAFSFICCLKLVQEWFPPSRFSTLAGMTNTAAMVGAAIGGGAPMAILVKSTGWRTSTVLIGIAELILAVLVGLMVRDRRSNASEPVATKESHRGGAAQVLKNPFIWINAVYCTSISLVLIAFGGLWSASYIKKAYAVNDIEAAGTGSLLFWGGIAGSLFYGWYSDYLGRRKLPMVQAGIAALVTMTCMFYLPGLPFIGFKIGLFLVGFFSSANIVSYAVARDLYPNLAGLSIGFLSTCYYAGSAASQPLVGWLLESRKPAGPDTGLAALTAGDYRFAFCPLVIFLVVGLVASLLMKETLTTITDKTPEPVPQN